MDLKEVWIKIIANQQSPSLDRVCSRVVVEHEILIIGIPAHIGQIVESSACTVGSSKTQTAAHDTGHEDNRYCLALNENFSNRIGGEARHRPVDLMPGNDPCIGHGSNQVPFEEEFYLLVERFEQEVTSAFRYVGEPYAATTVKYILPPATRTAGRVLLVGIYGSIR